MLTKLLTSLTLDDPTSMKSRGQIKNNRNKLTVIANNKHCSATPQSMA